MFDGISTVVLLVYVILLLLTLIVLTLVVLLVHSGLFRSVDDVGTGKPPIGQVIIAYRFQKGPYNQAGQIFTEAAIIAPHNKALGIYYDDPNKVESHNLRYVVGSILSEGTTPVDEEMVKQFTDREFKIIHLPEVSYAVHTKFPHITTLSILIGVYKAYPMLKDYIEEHKLCAYPYIEYYDGSMIHFFAPLSKQDEFYVPECEQDARGDQAADYDSTVLSTSQSSLNDSQLSPDLTQTSVEDEPEAKEDQSPIVERVVLAGGEENGNNNAEITDEQNMTKDEDQESEDSTSSFELLKPNE